ncbi:MAG TPA: hypothetical protein VJU87_04910 [Gemmatimonadaceae bacterium]|nr:hypothetical protein [Gemmatimonadaceae bacterium]
MMRRSFRPDLSVLLSAALLAGCYRYERVSPVHLHPGDQVTIALSAAGADSLDRAVGPRATRLDGRIVSITDTSVTLGVTSVWRGIGSASNEELWSGDAVPVSTMAMDSLRVERIDRRRSWLAAAGAVAFAVVTRAVAAGDAFGRGGGTPPPVSR